MAEPRKVVIMLAMRLNRTFIVLLVVSLFFTLTPLSHEARDYGKIVFVSEREGNNEICVMNADGSNVVQLTDNFFEDLSPAWSPDGTKIVFVSDRDLNNEIYVMNADGSNVVQLTDNFDEDLNPAWSPDGTKIAFNSNRDGTPEIYVINADGSNTVRLTNDKDWNAAPVWSPDGKRIAYVCISLSDIFSIGGLPSRIRVIDADGSNMEDLSLEDDSSPAWSPDGERIAFDSFRNGNFEIYVMNADGTEQKRLTSNSRIDKMPAWSPDGERIAFVSNRDGNDEIYIMDADGSNMVRLTENSYRDYNPNWCGETETGMEKGFYLGTLLIVAFVGFWFLSKKWKTRTGLKILLIVVIVACLGLQFSFLNITDVDIPDSEKIPPQPEEITLPHPVQVTALPDSTKLGIVWIKIEYELYGSHGTRWEYWIAKHADGNYYIDKASGRVSHSTGTGQQVDVDLIQGLAESFTDFYPAQKLLYGGPRGLDGGIYFEVIVKLENEEALFMYSYPFFDQCCLIPWNIKYGDKKYMQLNGKISCALFRLLKGLGEDEELLIKYDKEIRWGCYPAVLDFKYYDRQLSEDFPQSNPKTTPLEEGGEKHLLWKADIPHSICSPVYAEGILYIVTESHIMAFDAEPAKKLWEVEIEKKETTLKGDLMTHEGIVYAAVPPFVYSLNAHTKDTVWKYTSDQDASLEVFISGTNLIVWEEGGSIKDKIVCLNAKTGDKIWEISGNLDFLDFFDGKVLYKARRLSGDFMYFYTLVDANSGEVIWEKDSSEFAKRWSDIINWHYYRGVLYIDKEKEGTFVAVDTETMEEHVLYSHEKFKTYYEQGALVQYCKVFEQGILLSFLEFGKREWPLRNWISHIVFLDKTGTKIWDYHYDEEDVGSLFSVSDLFYYQFLYNRVEGAEIFQNTLYVWRYGGFIEAFNIENGEKLWDGEVRDSVKSFQIYDKRIYVAANDCKLYCLDTDTGKIVWELLVCDSHCTAYADETIRSPAMPGTLTCTCEHFVYVVAMGNGVFFVITEDMLIAVSSEAVTP